MPPPNRPATVFSAASMAPWTFSVTFGSGFGPAGAW